MVRGAARGARRGRPQRLKCKPGILRGPLVGNNQGKSNKISESKRVKEEDMKKVDNIIIGFGKGGKTLAAYLGKKGEKTLLIERDPGMYGGTCINVGCIPSKSLSTKAGRKKYSQTETEAYYRASMEEKNKLIGLLNKANYDKLDGIEEVEIVDGLASFLDEHRILVTKDGTGEEYYAERIFINTGASPFIPEVKGLIPSKRILTSRELLSLPELPKRLTILGGGFIGLEFAKTFSEYGSEVTLLDASKEFLEREDEDVAEAVLQSMKELGVTIVLNAKIDEVKEEGAGTLIKYSKGSESCEIEQDYILVATGRRPNTADLDLEKAGIELGERGNIKVNEFLQTNKEHIFALGDVNGGPNFTYISLDDFRIVRGYLEGDRSYSTKDRRFIPTSVFLQPSLSKVGLSEKEARDKGYDIRVFKLPSSMIPRAKILGNQKGLYKAIVDTKTNKILGATLFAEGSHEVINIIVTAMLMDADYSVLKNQIFTHPTMAEALNDLFQ